MMRVLVLVPLLFLAACGGSEQQAGKPEAPQSNPLLELAFDGVTQLPLDPHIRNRARAQAMLVDAALELEQAELAARFAEAIPNWRQTAAYADIATFYALDGNRAEAEVWLGKAEQMLQLAVDAREGRLFATGEMTSMLESMQEWRLDRIKVHVAKALLALGYEERAAGVSAGISKEEAPHIMAFKAKTSDPDSFNAIFTALSSLAESGQFEAVKGAVEGLAALYDRHYDDEDKRTRVGEAINRYRVEIPLFLQIETLISLAWSAHGHGDPVTSGAIAQEADVLLEEARYLPRMYFPMKSQIIQLTCLAGNPDAALPELERLLQKYEAARGEIIDIYRAAIVCRLAEAAAVVSGDEKARALYAKAVDEGLVNANGRPRADDLNEICRSVALHGVVPADVLMMKLQTMKNELGSPW